MAAASHTKACTPAIRVGRLHKAKQFLAAADLLAEFTGEDDELGDAYVTLCVHAGIAAADVICCARLGKHATGQDHVAAVKLLKAADGSAAKHLNRLLGMKTKAGYTSSPVNATERKAAGKAAAALVDAATLA